MPRPLFISILVLSASISLTPAALAQIEVGQIDTFDGILTYDWERGDNFGGQLQVTGDGNGQGGAIVTFNRTQWAGDYLAAGVEAIRLDLENLGSQQPEVIRLALGDAGSPSVPGSTWFATIDGVTLVSGQSGTFTFDLAGISLVRVQGEATYSEVLSNVVTLRVLNNPEPDARGAIGVGFGGLGIDNVAALGAPTAAPAATTLATLRPAFPNPFNPSTTIAFSLAAPSPVELTIVDLRGRVVRSLATGMLAAGDHQRVWDGTDAAGRPLASGTYLARLQAGEAVSSQRLTLIE